MQVFILCWGSFRDFDFWGGCILRVVSSSKLLSRFPCPKKSYTGPNITPCNFDITSELAWQVSNSNIQQNGTACWWERASWGSIAEGKTSCFGVIIRILHSRSSPYRFGCSSLWQKPKLRTRKIALEWVLHWPTNLVYCIGSRPIRRSIYPFLRQTASLQVDSKEKKYKALHFAG